MAVLRALFVVFVVSACVEVIVSVDNHGPLGHQGGQALFELIDNLPSSTPGIPIESSSLSSASNENQITKVPERQPLDPNFDAAYSNKIAMNVFDLSQRLVQNVLKKSEVGKNYEILSPISIASALQLALLGAKGKTFIELMRVLGHSSSSMTGLDAATVHEQFGYLLEDLVNNDLNQTRARAEVPWRAKATDSYLLKINKPLKNNAVPKHVITVANGIFVQKGFSIRPEYADAVKSVYNSELRILDFRAEPAKAADEINKWVNDKTNGRIKQLIAGSADTRTRVILANALYFKAGWQHTFFPGVTQKKSFYTNGLKDDKNVVMVDMMANGGDFPHYYDSETDCEIMGFPYVKKASTMYVIMPRNSSNKVLREKQQILTAEKIDFMISQMTIKTAVILFPKMHLSGSFNLKTDLEALELRELFKPTESDLSLLADGSQDGQAEAEILERQNEDMESAIHFPDDEKSRKSVTKRDVSYKVPSETKAHSEQLTLKDLVLKKRIIKESSGKKAHRVKRDNMSALKKIDEIRRSDSRVPLKNPYLYADEVIHKVDLEINEEGTEGGAATAINLNRSGTNVVYRVEVPFMILIRHDPTRLPLFYGTIFNPLQ